MLCNTADERCADFSRRGNKADAISAQSDVQKIEIIL